MILFLSLIVARHFSQLLLRQTSLLHLAQAARTVLHNAEPVIQMANDLKEIRLEDMMHQILWIKNEKVDESQDLLAKCKITCFLFFTHFYFYNF